MSPSAAAAAAANRPLPVTTANAEAAAAGSKQHLESATEAGAEVVVDDRINAAVRRAEPLRHGDDGADEPLVADAASRQTRSEIDAGVDGVQRQPADGEDDDDDDEHPKNAHARAIDGGGALDEVRRPAVTPDVVADERVADADERQRRCVARQQNGAEEEGSFGVT